MGHNIFGTDLFAMICCPFRCDFRAGHNSFKIVRAFILSILGMCQLVTPIAKGGITRSVIPHKHDKHHKDYKHVHKRERTRGKAFCTLDYAILRASLCSVFSSLSKIALLFSRFVVLCCTYTLFRKRMNEKTKITAI